MHILQTGQSVWLSFEVRLQTWEAICVCERYFFFSTKVLFVYLFLLIALYFNFGFVYLYLI